MTDAPDQIYAAAPYSEDGVTPDWQSGAGEWDVSPNWATDHVTYIRLDLHEAAVAAARAEAWNEALEKAAAFHDEQMQQCDAAASTAVMSEHIRLFDTIATAQEDSGTTIRALKVRP